MGRRTNGGKGIRPTRSYARRTYYINPNTANLDEFLDIYMRRNRRNAETNDQTQITDNTTQITTILNELGDALTRFVNLYEEVHDLTRGNDQEESAQRLENAQVQPEEERLIYSERVDETQTVENNAENEASAITANTDVQTVVDSSSEQRNTTSRQRRNERRHLRTENSESSIAPRAEIAQTENPTTTDELKEKEMSGQA